MKNIGQRIKQKREELGWTQEDLANRMGYKSKSTINKIEMGINDVTQSKIVKFAEILDTSISFLMGWDQEQIDTLTEIENDRISYVTETESNLISLIKEFTENEMAELLDYAKYIISKRK